MIETKRKGALILRLRSGWALARNSRTFFQRWALRPPLAVERRKTDREADKTMSIFPDYENRALTPDPFSVPSKPAGRERGTLR